MYAPDPNEKLDFDCLDKRLYLALQRVLPYADAERSNLWVIFNADDDAQMEAEAIKADQAITDAKHVMYCFENSYGPLPDWAVSRNFSYKLVAGAQLCTKDGRVSGNAHVLRSYMKDTGRELNKLYDCITDAGSYMRGLSEQDINQQYWIGDFISNPETLIDRFGKHDEDYGLPENPHV